MVNDQLGQTRDICSGQLMVSQIRNNINVRNKIIENFAILLIYVFLHGGSLHCLVPLHL